MENSHLQLTIREMRQQASSTRFWAGLLGVVCILTVSAPFDTGEQFKNIPRFFYWLGVAASTYFTAIFVLLWVCRQLEEMGRSEASARVIASLVSAISVALLVFFINVVVLGIDELRWKTFVLLGGNCVLISLAVSAIFFIVNDSLQNRKTSEPAPDQPMPIFYQRLPQELGTDLISLQAQDHYVEAKTA